METLGNNPLVATHLVCDLSCDRCMILNRFPQQLVSAASKYGLWIGIWNRNTRAVRERCAPGEGSACLPHLGPRGNKIQ